MQAAALAVAEPEPSSPVVRSGRGAHRQARRTRVYVEESSSNVYDSEQETYNRSPMKRKTGAKEQADGDFCIANNKDGADSSYDYLDVAQS